MGKRSEFPRRKNDEYDTPPEAVAPLIPHLPVEYWYWEPCAGAGCLVEALWDLSQPKAEPKAIMSDIAPRSNDVFQDDAFQRGVDDRMDYIITNPPWTRSILHPMIEHFSDMRPTWLLFDADWMHTKQAAPYLWRLQKIVSVGRVKWIKDSPHTGKDNVAWYCFDSRHDGRPPQFFGRQWQFDANNMQPPRFFGRQA